MGHPNADGTTQVVSVRIVEKLFECLGGPAGPMMESTAQRCVRHDMMPVDGLRWFIFEFSDSCFVVFLASLSADESNQEDYYVYYNLNIFIRCLYYF